ncbi:hypothetical protein GmHk_04G010537 [Glycine max]|nr:hypothetical protein GmHk_04G010537 [Glycine max]
MMREAVSNQCFTSFLVGSNKLPVDVLQYADDTIFFGEASMANVKTVKVTLRSFELVSVLRINFAKSKFGAVGQSEEWSLHATNYLNCALLQFPFCYLGIPNGVNPKRKVVWDPIIRKFEDRLNRWKMGRADQILFSEDGWAEDGIPLKDQFPERQKLMKHLWARTLMSKYGGWNDLIHGRNCTGFSNWWKDLKSIFQQQHRSLKPNLQNGSKQAYLWEAESLSLIQFYQNILLCI